MSKMINCKACGKEIAKGVKKCVHCGKDQRNFFMKHKILTVILALVVLGGIGSALGDNEDSTATTTTTVAADANKTEVKTEEKKEVVALKVSAVDLANAYETNEVKADKDYKDKLIETTGQITDIGVSFGQTYIVLSSGKEFSLVDVQCFFKDKAEIDKIASLEKGGTVTVQGTVDGKSMNVGVNDCILK